MGRNDSKKVTDAELQVLNILWHRGPSTVREVHEILTELREIRYTTTLKTLQVMSGKCLVKRDEAQKAHIYEAAVSRGRSRRQGIQWLSSRIDGRGTFGQKGFYGRARGDTSTAGSSRGGREMNGLIPLTESSVQALGWMLLHFVWQGFAVAAILAGTRVVIRDPRLRYSIACGALFTMVLLAGFTLLKQDLDRPSQAGPSEIYSRSVSPTFEEPAPSPALTPGEQPVLPAKLSDLPVQWRGLATRLQAHLTEIGGDGKTSFFDTVCDTDECDVIHLVDHFTIGARGSINLMPSSSSTSKPSSRSHDGLGSSSTLVMQTVRGVFINTG
jgi:predicted transcriptional regulator